MRELLKLSAIALAVVALTSCGGSSSSTPAATETPATATPVETPATATPTATPSGDKTETTQKN